MNLNQTFCASYCKNYQCPKKLGHSHLCAAEKRGIPLGQIKTADLSAECSDYLPPDLKPD